MMSDRSAKRSGSAFAAFDEKVLQRFGVGFGRQNLTIFFGDADDAQPPLRRAHHAAQRRRAVRSEVTRCAGVGCNHDFFNQLARTVVHLELDVGHALAVKRDTRLEAFKFQGTFAVAACAQLLGKGVLGAQLRIHAGNGGSRSG